MRYLFIKNLLMLLLLPSALIAHRLPEPIILKTASIIDGSFITWKTLTEIVHPFMQRLYERVFGVITSTGVQGLYSYNDGEYTLDALAEYENQCVQTDRNFLLLFEDIKADLIDLGNEFFAGSERAKPIVAHLIKESCVARNKKDCVLMIWACTKDHQERDLFQTHIRTMNSLRNFCIDLLTFLHDFVHSCPKACKQLHLELEKWSEVKKLIPLMIEEKDLTLTSSEKSEFLHYLKQQALSGVLLDQINSEWIYSHYIVFHGKR